MNFPLYTEEIASDITLPRDVVKNEGYLPRVFREGWYEVQIVLRDCSSELVRLTEKVHDWNICRAKIEPVEPNVLQEDCFLKI